jgi:riboflavin synthase
VFTGIVEQVGVVEDFTSGTLLVRAENDPSDPFRVGESVAVNGCCLTVASHDGHLRFDLSGETLSRTALGSLQRGSLLNLERAMRADGRFGGHIVQGHVDAVGHVADISTGENAHILRFRAPEGYERYLIDKGSVTISGISLTVVSPKGPEFDVWIIPHTWEHTNLHGLRRGDAVNMEFDVLAKYVERLLQGKSP